MSEVQPSQKSDHSSAAASSSLDLLFGTTTPGAIVDAITVFEEPNSTLVDIPRPHDKRREAVTGEGSGQVTRELTGELTGEVSGHVSSKLIGQVIGQVTSKVTGEVDGVSIERDYKGRVILARFDCGQVCQFRYDASGNLYAFSYARLAWSTTDGASWIARDQTMVYSLDASVNVSNDGCIVIARPEVTRTLRLNGAISDLHSNGKCTESKRAHGEFSWQDLLASSDVRTDGPVTLQHERPGISRPIERPIDKRDGITSLRIDAATAASRVSDRQRIIPGKRITRLRRMDDVQLVHQQPMEEAKSAFAAKVAEYSVKIIEALQGPEHVSLAPHLDVLAAVAYQQRKIDEARRLHERSLSIKNAKFGTDYAETGVNLHGLARIYHEWGRYAEAEQHYVQAARVFEKGLQKSRFLLNTGAVAAAHTTGHLRRYINCLHSLATLYSEQAMHDYNAKIYESAMQACASVDPEHVGAVSGLMNDLAVIAAQASER